MSKMDRKILFIILFPLYTLPVFAYNQSSVSLVNPHVGSVRLTSRDNPLIASDHRLNSQPSQSSHGDSSSSANDQTNKIALQPFPLSDYHSFYPPSSMLPMPNQLQIPNYQNHLPRYPMDPYFSTDPHEIFIPLKKPWKKKPSPPPSERVITADPLLVLAIITLPLLALLTFTAVIVPLIPIVIYLFAAFSATGPTLGRRRRRSTLENEASVSSNMVLESNIFRTINKALDKLF